MSLALSGGDFRCLTTGLAFRQFRPRAVHRPATLQKARAMLPHRRGSNCLSCLKGKEMAEVFTSGHWSSWGTDGENRGSRA
jgi:hypothetical protein